MSKLIVTEYVSLDGVMEESPQARHVDQVSISA